MAKDLVRAGGALKKAAKKSALKKAAKKIPGKKAPGKKAAKKAAGKKGAKRVTAAKHISGGVARAFHHLQRAAAVISLLEGESGGDLRMLLEAGVVRYRNGVEGVGLLRAAEHLGMAGLYAARASHRLDVQAPSENMVEDLIEQVAERVDGLEESGASGFEGRLLAMAEELLGRAEAAVDHDLHLAWELAMAAEGICEGMEA